MEFSFGVDFLSSSGQSTKEEVVEEAADNEACDSDGESKDPICALFNFRSGPIKSRSTPPSGFSPSTSSSVLSPTAVLLFYHGIP